MGKRACHYYQGNGRLACGPVRPGRDRTPRPELVTCRHCQRAVAREVRSGTAVYVPSDRVRDMATGRFWSPGAVRFFSSRLLGGARIVPGGVLFITGERMRPDARRYTVRFCAAASGAVETVGEFQEYRTVRAARRAQLAEVVRRVKGVLA